MILNLTTLLVDDFLNFAKSYCATEEVLDFSYTQIS